MKHRVLLSFLAAVVWLAWVLPDGRGRVGPRGTRWSDPGRAFLAERGVERSESTLLPGSRFATPYYTLRHRRSGPVVVVVGGVHGNEPAGAYAARQIAVSWSIARGTLVVVPEAHRTALAAGTREDPDADGESDLNRCFPSAEDEAPSGELASALWALVSDLDPDWVVDLHEGFDFTRVRPESVGNSVIASTSAAAERVAEAIVAAVDTTIEAEVERFDLKRRPVEGSLARAASERLGCDALIVETTWKGQALSRRAWQQRIAVYCVLEALGMAVHGPDRIAPLLDLSPVAGVWDDEGSDEEAIRAFEDASRSGSPLRVERIGRLDVARRALDRFAVIVVAGGRGSLVGAGLGEHGAGEIREWIARGGVWVGVGGGAYLSTGEFDWSLGVTRARLVDPEEWRRGEGSVGLELTDEGRRLLGVEEPRLDAWFRNGPVVVFPPGATDTATILARFERRQADGSRLAELSGTPAIWTESCGRGRILVASPRLDGRDDTVRALICAISRIAQRQ